MNSIDFEDRWVYKGSYTEPPCNGGVYWNVIRTVYPIASNTLETIKRKMMFNSAEVDNGYTFEDIYMKEDDDGNFIKTPPLKMYRKLQKVNSQNIKYMSSVYLGKMAATIAAFATALVIV